VSRDRKGFGEGDLPKPFGLREEERIQSKAMLRPPMGLLAAEDGIDRIYKPFRAITMPCNVSVVMLIPFPPTIGIARRMVKKQFTALYSFHAFAMFSMNLKTIGDNLREPCSMGGIVGPGCRRCHDAEIARGIITRLYRQWSWNIGCSKGRFHTTSDFLFILI
jgi:hypothetical protein